MRIVLVSPSDSFFQNLLIEETIERLRGKHEILLCGMDMPKSGSASSISKMMRLLGITNFLIIAIRLLAVRISMYFRLYRFLGSPVTLGLIANRQDIPFEHWKSVNAIDFIQRINRFSPDIIINTNGEIYDTPTINLPRLGVLNVHIGTLPGYRSPLPVFWALFDGASKLGITMHLIEKKIDAGHIILNREFYYPGKDLLGAMSFLNRHCPVMIEECIELLSTHKLTYFSMIEDSPYRPFPSKTDIHEFKSRGYRIGWVLGTDSA